MARWCTATFISLPVLMILLTAMTLAGCSGDTPACRVGADCASGACRADGTCAPGADATSGFAWADTTAQADAPGGDAPPPVDNGPAADASPDPIVCSNDGDGVIEREKVPMAAELSSTFRIASDVTVDTAGTTDESGNRIWSLDGPLPGDQKVLVETLPVSGTWFAAKFPGATYAARLSQSEELLGVFEAAPSALLLRGVVSPEDGLLRTELTLDPPVVVLKFPLALGATWSTSTAVSGVALGVPGIYSEDYVQSIDDAGTLETPYGSFDVLRVHVTLKRTVGLLTTTVHTHLFVTECFGTVASIVSKSGESGPEFTEAAEVRRLGP